MKSWLMKKSGPLYWCSYEYQYEHNQYMPEEEWKKNIDWIADEFVPYGYEMVCTDGWIEESTDTNENGYIRSHHNSWKHDWRYWADYCDQRDLKLGIYYNPLWVLPAAVEDCRKVVAGTDIPIGSIVDSDYLFEGENCGTAGDRFFYGNREKALYWVDVDRPGAKEYVQGYVRYFIDQGASFLRIDFLSWFEDGIDKGNRVGKNHGREAYRKALSWIWEAAKDELMISLVMPHLKENGSSEFGFGQMARINEDCAGGGWQRFCQENRGIRFSWWSQYSNPFDGLTAWAKLFHENSLIPDADMLRLHTFCTEQEKKIAVSLCIMAGAPVDIADQYGTIGDDGWIYRNEELLELNKKGFCGIPLSSDPAKVQSQIWYGQLDMNTCVVGLFNREDTPQRRRVVFKELMGVQSCELRDLWEHKELGKAAEYDEILDAHACRILKVSGLQSNKNE